MIHQYQVGVVTLEQGSDLVAGHGTSWLTYLKPGDRLAIGALELPIAEILTVAQLRLTAPYPGPSAARITYRILIAQE